MKDNNYINIENIKESKGITLIALVITVVVISILAGVSIDVILGENGLITKAKYAEYFMEEAKFESDVKLLSLDYATSMILSENGKDKLIEELENRQYMFENIEDEYLIVYNKVTNSKRVIDLSNGEVSEYIEYKEEDLSRVIDTSIWDGTSSDGLIGEGTLLQPYLICSAKDFSYFRDQVNSKKEIKGLNIDKTENGKNVDARYAKIKMMTDVYLNDITNFDSWDENTTGLNTWKPIGNYLHSGAYSAFTGKFNGNNYKIVGMYMKYESSSSQKQGGVFGYAERADIYNLGTEYSYIYIAVEREGSNTVIGSTGTIVGYSWGSNIHNCYSEKAKLYGKSFLGGIVGQAKYSKTDTKRTISNCHFNGEIQFLEITKEDWINSGGVVGCINGSFNNTLINCYNEGNIKILNESVAEISVGGISGSVCQGTEIYNSYNTGNIEVNPKNICNVGGIVGQAYINTSTPAIIIQNCYNTGNITGGAYKNGLVAQMIIKGPVKINNCYSIGTIEGENITDGNVILVHKPIDGTRVTNSYILIENKIYKWECLKNNADTFAEQTLSAIDLYSVDFIKNTLNWDENIWNITGSGHPTLK